MSLLLPRTEALRLCCLWVRTGVLAAVFMECFTASSARGVQNRGFWVVGRPVPTGWHPPKTSGLTEAGCSVSPVTSAIMLCLVLRRQPLLSRPICWLQCGWVVTVVGHLLCADFIECLSGRADYPDYMCWEGHIAGTKGVVRP